MEPCKLKPKEKEAKEKEPVKEPVKEPIDYDQMRRRQLKKIMDESMYLTEWRPMNDW